MKTGAFLLRGECRVLIWGNFPENVLNSCALQAIEIWDIDCSSANSMTVTTYENTVAELEEVAAACMCSSELIESFGGKDIKLFVKNHMGLLASAGFFVLLLLISSLFIWNIEVRGNSTLTSSQIIRALEDCGVGIGTYRQSIKTDVLRGKMIERLPELAWMTVNVNGSRAIVVVSEREETITPYELADISDIVAKTEGIIEKVLALNGKPLVNAGQMVMKGEVLISSEMDSITDVPIYVNAYGKVIALTGREYTAVCPQVKKIKKPSERMKRRFAIQFGKKRMNFYFNSGKTVDESDKTIHNYIIGIKDVFALPLRFIVEEIKPYEIEEIVKNDSKKMSEHLEERVRKNIEGEILKISTSDRIKYGLIYTTLRCECRENIAAVRRYREDAIK